MSQGIQNEKFSVVASFVITQHWYRRFLCMPPELGGRDGMTGQSTREKQAILNMIDAHGIFNRNSYSRWETKRKSPTDKSIDAGLPFFWSAPKNPVITIIQTRQLPGIWRHQRVNASTRSSIVLQ
jgi:hypothetical protein